ncbi:peptide ABC transporter substrate-binding protein [Larsenimonas rhizosphaerae]|uniref:peptide ABC transporter substrate-binding protein n=1 Tax=Larsenimonas rhizosphaerae TaxID=2944682 RepID=UPI002034052C|nr:peptide ABC transporter substrate-binding protein [Larsenimonas rhizosphaerae]MCM2131666.1 peptide ABC transporter substrate-binding protein [Larsenimonas rhizosphaerae]
MQPRTFYRATALTLGLGAAPFAFADTLNVGISGDPASLDPAKITGGVWEEDILRDIYEGLVSVSSEGDIIPGVAESWNVSDDGTIWTFTLRGDARWSDGTPVTANDFVAGLRHQLDPKTAANYAQRLYPIKNAQAINGGKMPVDQLGATASKDGRTLTITLNEPTAYFFKSLVLPIGYPIPAHLVKEYGDTWSDIGHIVTNGAFTPTKWVSHSELTTVKNTHFHDADAVSLDGVDYFPMEDKNAGIQRFRAGELDILRDFPASRYQWLKKNLPQATHLFPSLGTYYYVYNLKDGSPVTDVRVRKALSLAINRKVIAEKLLDGAVTPATTLVPPGTAHYNAQSQPGLDAPYEERLDTARALMKEAGYGPDHPLRLTLRYNSGDEHKRIAVAVAAMWKPLGVNAELRNTEANVHYADLMAGNFEVARAAWISSIDDAQNFLQLLLQKSNNYGNYQNTEYQSLMARSDTEQDADARESLMERAEKLALAEYPLTPIYTYSSRNLVTPDLDGWNNNALDIHPSRWMSLKDK